MSTWRNLGLHYGGSWPRGQLAEFSPEPSQMLLADYVTQQLSGELDRLAFISLGKLQQVLGKNQISRLLHRSGGRDNFELIDHISGNCTKIFSLLLLTGGYLSTIAFIHSNTIAFVHSSHKLYDSMFDDFMDNGDFLKRKVDLIPTDIPLPWRSSWLRVLEHQWTIPPVLTVDGVRKYPKQFILPFFEKEEIGQGSFGQVFKACVGWGHLLECKPSTVIAFKKITDAAIKPEELREVTSLWARKHYHVLPLLAAFVVEDDSCENLFIVTPYARGGDMEAWLSSESVPNYPHQLGDPLWREDFLYETMLSLLKAVTFIHSGIQGRWCGHFDIKPKNIFLFEEDGQWVWKLGDFGLSNLKSTSSQGVIYDIGTDEYHPPEYHESPRETPHGPPFDVYSLGCVFLQLMTLIIFPWVGRRIQAFKREFETSKSGKKTFVFRAANVTKGWSTYLLQGASEVKSKQAIRIISGMLYSPFQDRSFAFDAALDFLELLNPRMELSEYERNCQELMKGQEPKFKFGNFYDPVVRAMKNFYQRPRSYTSIRTRCLVENGWADRRSSTIRQIPGSTGTQISAPVISLSTLPAEINEDYFVGRQNLLDDIEWRFENTPIVSLFGLGGVGKSHLASKYAWNASEKANQAGYTLHTFWVQCRNMSSFEESYDSIIRAIKPENPRRQPTKRNLKKWFGNLKCFWILILDGVEELHPEWKELCPYKEAYEKGRILITTKDRRIARELCTQIHYAIEVQPLDEADNVNLFRRFKSPSEPNDEEYAKQIVNILRLPILIKLIAKSITHNSEAEQGISSVAKKLSDQQILTEQIGELDTRDPRYNYDKAVSRVFHIVFDKELLKETTLRNMLMIVCCYSKDAIDRSWFNLEFGEKDTKKFFGIFTNRLYLKQQIRLGMLYSTHEMVQILFNALIQETANNPDKDMWEAYMRAISMLYYHYKERKNIIQEPTLDSNNSINADRATPLHLLKLQYKDHIEEFLKYVQHPKSVLAPFWRQAAMGVITFARWFDDEGRSDVGQLLLKTILTQGITIDKGRSVELRARLDLVQSLVISARGRKTIDMLQRAEQEAKSALDSAEAVHNAAFIWKIRREQLHLLCRSRKWNLADKLLKDLSRTTSDVDEEEEKTQLDIIECEAICASGRGEATSIRNVLDYSRDRWELLINRLEKSSLDEQHKVERLERARLSLADSCLTIMERLRLWSSIEKDVVNDAKQYERIARDLYGRVKTEREERYAALARQYGNHKHVIDVKYREAVGYFRIGVWNKRSAQVADIAETLQGILISYREEAELDNWDPEVRDCAYRLEDALRFLLEHKRSSEYDKQLELLRKDYNLKNRYEHET